MNLGQLPLNQPALLATPATAYTISSSAPIPLTEQTEIKAVETPQGGFVKVFVFDGDYEGTHLFLEEDTKLIQ